VLNAKRMIVIALALLFLSGSAGAVACNPTTDLQIFFVNQVKAALVINNKECVGHQTCDQLKWKGLDGDACPYYTALTSDVDYYVAPLHLPGMWDGNTVTFSLVGQSLNVSKEFDFAGYFPTYGGVNSSSLERTDMNNEFFGIRFEITREEDGTIVQEGEKVAIGAPVSVTAVADNIPDHMTAQIYDLTMVGQDTASPLSYKLWSKGYPFASCLTCEGRRNKIDKTVVVWENAFPEFSETMDSDPDDKIQVKYEITVTACGTSRKQCRGTPIGGKRSKRTIRRKLLAFLDNEPIEEIMKKPMIERPIVVEKNEKIRISFGANIVLLAIYFVVVNYAFIRYNTSKQ